ncbi:MAG TPA: SseB family protein [Candidatus Limnocylindria bacterium]
MTGEGGPGVGDLAPRPEALEEAELIVPVRSSSGEAPDPEGLTVDAFRHGTDEGGERFVAAFSSPETFAAFGPPGSDHVRLRGRELFARADEARVRVVIDPGAPSQVEVATGVLPFLAAGIDPNRPDALRARRPLGDLPALDPPGEVPEALGGGLRSTLEQLPQVERAWLLRSGDGWTVGVQLVPDADLGDFDAVRNRLHAVATEQLGSRRLLAVTDLRAPSLRETYDATAAPFYVRRDPPPRGFLARLLGR